MSNSRDGRRVVVTGLGVISSIGIGKEAFWDGLAQGKNGISLISAFDTTEFTTRFAGEVKDFDPAAYLHVKQMKRMDRTTHFAVAASKMAAQDSGIDFQKLGPDRVGVVIGTAMAGHGYILDQHTTLMTKGPMRINPFTALAGFPDACAGNVSIELGLTGPSFSISTACSSASDAMGYAFESIRTGKLDALLMGGAEASIFPRNFGCFLCGARDVNAQ